MATIRQQIINLLAEREMDARELSQVLSVPEKEINTHLAHIAQSVAAQGKKITIRPSQCKLCGYVFEQRRRFTRPGRCPACKRSHLESPRFRIR
ncbi:MAG: ArsR family transcriptional regulator [Desulfobacterales bacterium]|nr:MAG: ArsR family transcriptional regulator [Desulfobacterales bacterium]